MTEVDAPMPSPAAVAAARQAPLRLLPTGERRRAVHAAARRAARRADAADAAGAVPGAALPGALPGAPHHAAPVLRAAPALPGAGRPPTPPPYPAPPLPGGSSGSLAVRALAPDPRALPANIALPQATQAAALQSLMRARSVLQQHRDAPSAPPSAPPTAPSPPIHRAPPSRSEAYTPDDAE